jgi:hypothetical protein
LIAGEQKGVIQRKVHKLFQGRYKNLIVEEDSYSYTKSHPGRLESN